MNNERIQVGYVEASSRVQAPNLVYNTGDQNISGDKIFKNNIQIGDSLNAIYSDQDDSLVISGNQTTLRTLKLIAAGGIYDTSIIFGPGADGLVFNSPDYFFRNKRPEVRTLSPFSSRPVALLDEVVLNTGNQTISGIKTFAEGVDLNNIDNISLSGVDITITSGVVTSTNPLSAPNIVYNTGDQTISGVKNFSSRPTVNNTGVLLTGQNCFIINLFHSTDTQRVGHNYFGNVSAGTSNNRGHRQFPVLESCVAKKASWTQQSPSAGNPPLVSTGYFINATTNTTGIISTVLATPNDFVTNYTADFSPSIIISSGDFIVCSLFGPSYSASFPGSVRNSVNLYCYN